VLTEVGACAEAPLEKSLDNIMNISGGTGDRTDPVLGKQLLGANPHPTGDHHIDTFLSEKAWQQPWLVAGVR